MPRIWEYSPAPIRKSERHIMVAIGGFIDLFPIAAGAYATWMLFSGGADSMLLVGIIALTLAMLGASGYLGKFLGDNYCTRCINFSCVMNKVPKSLADEYLRRNPAFLEIWKDCGYEVDDVSAPG